MQKHITIIALLTCLCLAGCQKDYNPGPGDPISNYDPYENIDAPGKTVYLDATRGGSFRGDSGIRYVFPQNAFCDSAGNVVTGNVQIWVKDYLKMNNMMFGDVLTVYDQLPTASAGAIYIQATQEHHLLHLNKGKTFQAFMPQPGAPLTGMQLFVGHLTSMQLFAGHFSGPYPHVDWSAMGSSGSRRISYYNDTTIITSDTMNYCTAAQSFTSPDFKSFNVIADLEEVTTADHIRGYVLYDTYNYNVVWPIFMTHNNEFYVDHVLSVPVHFVLSCTIKGSFYAGILSQVPVQGGLYHVPLSRTTPEAFKAEVDKL